MEDVIVQASDSRVAASSPADARSPKPRLLFKAMIVLLASGVSAAGVTLMVMQMSRDAMVSNASASPVAHAYAGPPVPEKIGQFDVDPTVGKQLYNRSCASCHGPSGGGMPPQGVALRSSAFVLNTSDEELVAFTTLGRLPNDPKTLTRRFMPPLGGDRQLSQQDVADIVAYMRQMQHTAAHASAH